MVLLCACVVDAWVKLVVTLPARAQAGLLLGGCTIVGGAVCGSVLHAKPASVQRRVWWCMGGDACCLAGSGPKGSLAFLFWAS